MKRIILLTILLLGILGICSIVLHQNPITPMYKPQVEKALNVYGTQLMSCCTDPMTGYYRDGHCVTGPTDFGTHVVCAVMTQEFLDYTMKVGNDLCTARPEYRFPGLKAGDKWCLCATRWVEAYRDGVAPDLILQSTDIRMLDFVSLEELVAHAYEEQD